MVAGLAGLILAKEGALTPAQVKAKMFPFARTDGFTGAVWNADWGWGKMNAEPADVLGPTVHVVSPDGGGSYPAGQSISIQWTASDNFGVPIDSLFQDSGRPEPHRRGGNTGSTHGQPSGSTLRCGSRSCHGYRGNTGQDRRCESPYDS
jgi:hypothetical protein